LNEIPEVVLKDLKIKSVALIRGIVDIRYSDDNIAVSEKEYFLKVPGVGSFYACDGNMVEYSAEKGADPQWVQLYLNNQVLVALLHQRKIISFHASSFILDGLGVMILGETGSGKTSMTVAFAINGAGFMSDDLTPVVFKGNVPHVWSLDRRVKLRADSAEQLYIGSERLSDAESGTGKKYLHLERGSDDYHKLDIIMKIETGEVKEPVFVSLSPADRFALLRSEICSWEILAGMPETEAAYLQQLVQILEQVHFVKVIRPARITIARMHVALNQYLGSLL
jgi:hypothetical protein